MAILIVPPCFMSRADVWLFAELDWIVASEIVKCVIIVIIIDVYCTLRCVSINGNGVEDELTMPKYSGKKKCTKFFWTSA